jgi:O-succinylbenzoic acid--CoA ligase
MPQLVALDLPAGQAFVDALERSWVDGDAVVPIDQRLPRPAVEVVLNALRPSKIVDANGSHRRGDGRPVEEGDALVIPTSGTTGQPKGVVLTHQAVGASARATSAALGVDPGTDRWVACLPLAHIGGLSVVTRALITGTPFTLLPRFGVEEVERLADEGASLISLVATTLGRTDASGYRVVLLGGAAPPAALPDNVVTTYGMTETGSGVVYNGRPIDGVELRIGDGQTGAPGEVLVRGPMLLRGYRDGSTPITVGGWLATGDSGTLAADGTLSVFGRMAEVIVSGGEKVWPVPVEQLLGTHPLVSEAVVWKRPDREWGERVVAWIVPSEPSNPPTLDALRAFVSARLAPWAAPRELVVTSALPRTTSGKVRRLDLV